MLNSAWCARFALLVGFYETAGRVKHFLAIVDTTFKTSPFFGGLLVPVNLRTGERCCRVPHPSLFCLGGSFAPRSHRRAHLDVLQFMRHSDGQPASAFADLVRRRIREIQPHMRAGVDARS